MELSCADGVEADELAEREVDIRHFAQVQAVAEAPQSHDLGRGEG